MSRNQLIIGLADQQLANTIWDELQHLRGSSTGLTVGLSTSSLGFFGVTAVSQQALTTGSTVGNVITALKNLGLSS
jgi:hypothetical protein